MTTTSRRKASPRVSVRIDEEEHAALAAAAARTRLPMSRLAGILIAHGLAKLARRDPEIERAVRVTRDG